MNLFAVDNWLKTPNDRDIIARWTVGMKNSVSERDAVGTWYQMTMPQPDTPEWEFLALGDTGDSDASGPAFSPQDAVGQQLAADAGLPNTPGNAALVLHMGDVVYMTGERRLYDRNFRRPYRDFLTPESTVDNFIFRLPFLPVPGNHDYYDLGTWAMWLSRIPLLGAGLKALTHRLFAFSVPEGGSGMGRAYMEIFTDGANTPDSPLPYLPGQRTRIPNRYYQFQMGNVDFWAVDSNTLDAPPPDVRSIREVRGEAAAKLKALSARAKTVDRKLRKHQTALDRFREEQRNATAADSEKRAALIGQLAPLTAAIGKLRRALEEVTTPEALACRTRTLDAILIVERRWTEGASDLTSATQSPDTASAIADALKALEDANDDANTAMRSLENCLAALPEGSERAAILGARDEMDKGLDAWLSLSFPTPAELSEPIRLLSEEALDIQREIALERRRAHYRPEDHDALQLRWLDEGLAASVRDRPDAWRVVYLHHPPYTAIGNHCEKPDVINLRENVLPILQKHGVHLVLSGHSHGFEWFRSDALPYCGFFVTGGGGQITLRPSILTRGRIERYRSRYDSLRSAGVVEYATFGDGPVADDGETGMLYHHLRIEVTPDILRVRPVGVRRLERGGFRREEPPRVYHAPFLPSAGPSWETRPLDAVEIRRTETPRPIWSK